MPLPKGKKHWKWNGGRKTNHYGYVLINQPFHQHSNCDGYVFEHILIAENVLGKKLPENARVHHIDGVKSNNSNTNLVICNDHKYHFLLHQRQRSLEATGNPNMRKCCTCKTWKSLDTDFPKGSYHCRPCATERAKQWRLKNPERYKFHMHASTIRRRDRKNGKSI